LVVPRATVVHAREPHAELILSARDPEKREIGFGKIPRKTMTWCENRFRLQGRGSKAEGGDTKDRMGISNPARRNRDQSKE
jgi:hypothetical protein